MVYLEGGWWPNTEKKRCSIKNPRIKPSASEVLVREVATMCRITPTVFRTCSISSVELSFCHRPYGNNLEKQHQILHKQQRVPTAIDMDRVNKFTARKHIEKQSIKKVTFLSEWLLCHGNALNVCY